MAGISTIGTKFGYSETEEGTYTEVPVKTISDPIGSPETIDITTLQDTQYNTATGLSGSTSSNDMTANYDKTVFTAIQALSGKEVYQKITLPDGSSVAWKGMLTISLSDISVNSALEMTLHSFKSTDAVFTPAT